MNTKLLKKIAATAAMAAICVSLVACQEGAGTNEPAETTAPEITTPVASVPETTEPEVTIPDVTVPEATEPEVTEPEVTEPEITEPEVSEPDSTEPSQTPNEDFVLSGDWLDLQFILDGVGYQLNDPYKKLESNGWYFDLADYGYENGYVLNPGDKTFGTIRLKNDAYEKKIEVYIGFKNNSDTVKDILECDFWTISVQIEYGFKLVENHPEMTIGNGLKFGDTAQQVLDTCGPCEDIYVSEEYGYQVYTYCVDFNYYLRITVYDEYGITKIQLQDYSR